jgi:hypothetical protein
MGPLLALDSLDETPGRNYYGTVDECIAWDIQPLEGFESAPILKMATDYDIIVMDHPHIADAASATVRAVLRRDSTPSAGASRIADQFRAHVTF